VKNKLYVAERAIRYANGAITTFPIGVFSDKADAQKAASAVPKQIAGANPVIHQAFALIGIAEVGGAVTELIFTPGAGLVLPE
jgi:hypothetical protein